MLLIVILSCSFALSPSLAGMLFSFTFPCSIRASAFRREVYPELAIIFWILSMILCEFS